MPLSAQAVLEPRKAPVQARSTASVDAILQATIQVLLQVGKERLTTTRVARRAGVSVGTLYQYFPNKSALLQAVLRRHLAGIFGAMEAACDAHRGKTLEEMGTALVMAFLEAKLRDPKTSAALYAVSSDVDGAKISQQMSVRSNQAIVTMLESSSERLATDAQLAAWMLQATMVGVSRRILEGGTPERRLEEIRQELIFLARAYLKAASAGDARQVGAS